MTGLKHYERDLALPSRLGDATLELPAADCLLGLVRKHLGSAAMAEPIAARQTFARWKPGTAAVGSWLVRFSDGREQVVSYKAYAGSKSNHVARYFVPDEHGLAAVQPLAPLAHLGERSAFMTTFPADRVLRGAGRALDLRRTARSLDQAEIWAPRVMRRRSSRIELLRYKPERRAVLRLEARLKYRGEDSSTGAAGACTLAVRVVDPRAVKRIVTNRRACGLEHLPRLRHVDSAAGLLFEEWIVGDPVDSEDFSLARESGVILASLHEQNLRARGPKVDRVPQQRLLERVAGCARWIDELPPRPAVAPTCWVHGDFHPDQHTRGEAGLRLLDLDALRPGVPEEDIASWIADHLVVEPDASGRDAAALLLEGYGSGRSKLDAALLGRLVADELLLRAAAGLRRMQVGAEARALLLLERAAQALEEELLG